MQHANNKRRVVTLCGSTRFYEAFRKANFTETLAGNIVLSIGCDSHDIGRRMAKHAVRTGEVSFR